MPRWLKPTALALALTAGGYTALAWYDVVPGGWTLRGWVEPHPVREARRWAEQRAERLAVFAAEPPAVAGSVVFLGSSTIERFPLEDLFPGVPCLDRGIGNEDLAGLLERLDASLPEAIPAGVVVYPASIDFRHHGTQPLPLARRVGALLDAIAERAPGVPIAVIGILPELDMPAQMVSRLKQTNAGLQAACIERGAAFVPTDRPPVTAASGSLAPDTAADRLHLNAAGYAALAAWLLEDGGAVGRRLAE